MLVHGQAGVPDVTWRVAETHIVGLMHYGSRIRTWVYDEEAILYGTLSVKENLDFEAQLLSNAVEKDHLEVIPGITGKRINAELVIYKVNERPIVFVAYSLGVLIVKRVSSDYRTDMEGTDSTGFVRSSKVRNVVVAVSLYTRHSINLPSLSDMRVANF